MKTFVLTELLSQKHKMHVLKLFDRDISLEFTFTLTLKFVISVF